MDLEHMINLIKDALATAQVLSLASQDINLSNTPGPNLSNTPGPNLSNSPSPNLG